LSRNEFIAKIKIWLWHNIFIIFWKFRIECVSNILYIRNIWNIGFRDPKPRFWSKTRSIVLFQIFRIFLWNTNFLIMTQYFYNFIKFQQIWCFNFRESTKFGIFCLSQGLSYKHYLYKSCIVRQVCVQKKSWNKRQSCIT